MARLDWLRISLLASLTGCGANDSAGAGSSTDDVSTGDTGAGVCPSPCEDPVEIADGVVRCADGRVNRVTSRPLTLPVSAPSCRGDEDALYCTTDAECPGVGTRCISRRDHSWGLTYNTYWSTCECSCASDSDCHEGNICMVPAWLVPVPDPEPSQDDWPTCVPSNCATNSDCGECGECGLGNRTFDCVAVLAASCRTSEDTCVGQGDCNCSPSPHSIGWSCDNSDCSYGRPLVVDHSPRTAALRGRADWAAPGLSTGVVDEDLAAYWAEVASFEHASVASFARFATQLLALGAPARLLRACTLAARDEVEHARLAYGLASAHARKPLGPDRLSLVGVEVETSWRAVVSELIVEACVGETLGVAEAMVAAEQARAAEVRAVWRRILGDELRHAQLAWQCLEWLLGQAEVGDRAWALGLLERTITARSQAQSTTTAGRDLDRPDEGVLGPARRASVWREASVSVLAPLARSLAR